MSYYWINIITITKLIGRLTRQLWIYIENYQQIIPENHKKTYKATIQTDLYSIKAAEWLTIKRRLYCEPFSLFQTRFFNIFPGFRTKAWKIDFQIKHCTAHTSRSIDIFMRRRAWKAPRPFGVELSRGRRRIFRNFPGRAKSGEKKSHHQFLAPPRKIQTSARFVDFLSIWYIKKRY